MKNKILEQLKITYANLGLGDKVLDGVAETIKPSVQTDEDIEAAVKSVSGLLKGFQAEADQIRTAKANAEKKALEFEAKIKELEAKPIDKPVNPNIDELREEFKRSMQEETVKMQQELSAYKNALQAEKRTSFINSEAKKLGIPDVILGNLNIDSNLDDAGVTAKLTEIKQVFVNNSIQPNVPTILAKDEVSTDEVSEILKLMK